MSSGQWVRGQSGNPAGRRRKLTIDDHLREELATGRGKAAKALVARLLGEAVKGDIGALRLVFERAVGKPKSAEETTAGHSEALTVEQVRAKLAELLARPEVRQSLQAMLTELKPQLEAVPTSGSTGAAVQTEAVQ